MFFVSPHPAGVLHSGDTKSIHDCNFPHQLHLLLRTAPIGPFRNPGLSTWPANGSATPISPAPGSMTTPTRSPPTATSPWDTTPTAVSPPGRSMARPPPTSTISKTASAQSGTTAVPRSPPTATTPSDDGYGKKWAAAAGTSFTARKGLLPSWMLVVQ